MKILRREGKGYKDYYDFLQQVYGQDELVVYDRRECFPIDPTKKWDDCSNCRHAYPNSLSDFHNSNVEKWFSKNCIYGDKKRESVKRWNSNKVLTYKEQDEETKGMSFEKRSKVRSSWEEVKEGRIFHFVLEIGLHHYYFEVERYLDDDDETKLHLNYGLIRKKDISKDEKISYAPICIAPVIHKNHSWFYGNGNDEFVINDDTREQKIDNPILYSTYIPKFIDAYEVWNNLYEYISSLRDKDFEDTRTNEQHIESHGFDKKISFRHRKSK